MGACSIGQEVIGEGRGGLDRTLSDKIGPVHVWCTPLEKSVPVDRDPFGVIEFIVDFDYDTISFANLENVIQ